MTSTINVLCDDAIDLLAEKIYYSEGGDREWLFLVRDIKESYRDSAREALHIGEVNKKAEKPFPQAHENGRGGNDGK